MNETPAMCGLAKKNRDAPYQDSRVTDGTWKDEPFDLVLGYVNIAVEPESSTVPNGE